MPDRMKIDDISAIRMQLESANQDHVANLSSQYNSLIILSYVGELVRV